MDGGLHVNVQGSIHRKSVQYGRACSGSANLFQCIIQIEPEMIKSQKQLICH